MQFRKFLAMLLAVVMTAGTFVSAIPISVSAAEVQTQERTSNLVDGYTDPWSTDVLPELTAPGDQNVDDIKFTHNEYTGLTVDGVHNEDVFGVNREEASVFSTTGILYDSVESALSGAMEYNREGSRYFQMLTGPEQADWSLTVLKNAEDADSEGYRDFYKPGYELFTDNRAEHTDHGYGVWKTGLQLPARWEYFGFDYSIYTNVGVPWQAEDNRSTSYCPAAPVNFNPVGLYRKTFTVNDSLKESGGRIYLNLQGAESAYYVYINGKEVGYSEDSYDPHSFDVTDYLVEGENLLAVKVHRFCDGTWFELQDMFKDGGIFRDIYLYSAPLVHIDDYFVTTDLDENYVNATMNLDLTVRNSADTPAQGYKVDVRLYDENGEMFFNGMTVDIPDIPAATAKTGNEAIIAHTNVGEASASATVYAPKLWTAETPNLYYLVLSLYSADGEYMGSMAQQHGFREIEFTRNEVDENGNTITPTEDYQPVTINGQRLLLKGANRHETDPVYGKYISHDVMELDVAIMKQNNINAVSTAHYTNDDYFYWLCNKYGLYVNAEPNLECHQLQSAGAGDKLALCKEIILDRGKAALEQLKNVTAIVVWEDNNECYWSNDKNYGGGAMYELLWYFKNEDGTRPVVDAGNTDSSTYGMGNGADLGNHGYSERYVMEDLATFQRPWLMTEYSHSMGNATGSIYEYWEYVRANEFALGGFIWDLIDQGRQVSLAGEASAGCVLTESASGKVGQVQLSSESSFIDVSDEKALTTKAISGNSYIVFDDADGAVNGLMSGTGKSFTLEVICKPTSLSGNQILVAKGDTQIAIKTNANGQLEMFGYDEPNGSGEYYTMTAAVPDNWLNNWHQVVGVYDKGTMSLYVDGELLATKEAGGSGLFASSQLLSFGYQTDERNSFDGAISMGRVYTRALTAEEIQAQNSLTPAITADSSDVFIWADSAELDPDSEGTILYTDFDYYGQDYAKETLYDNAGYFYGYGGDNGEVYHDGNFCQNGLLLPDRTVQPEMYEVKYTYQDYLFTASEEDLKAGKVSVFNETSFTDLSQHTLKWALLEDGKTIAEGTVSGASVAPWQTAVIEIPYLAYLPETLKAGGEYYLNLSVCTNEGTDMVPMGHELSYEQFELPADVEKVQYAPVTEGVTIDESGEMIEVSGADFHFSVSKDTGIIENYYFKDELLLEQGPVPNYWRALMDNDKRYDSSWKTATVGLEAASIAVGKNEEGVDKIEVVFSFPNEPALDQTMTYLIEGSGAVTVSTTVDATSFSGSYNRFIRIGTNLVLPAGFEDVSWYGGGPVEALYDRERFTRVGLYETTVDDLFFPYMSVNDTGTLTGVSWFTVTGENSNSALAMAAYEPLECAALHYTLDDLSDADHPYELEHQAKTYLGINYRSQGTGNATCGPDVWEEYVLPTSQVYSYSYTLIPYEKGADVTDLTRSYRTVPSIEVIKLNAEALSQKIDGLYVTNASQLAEVEDLVAEYEALTDFGKSVVGENRYTKLQESLTLARKLTDGGITVGVRDLSTNGFDMDISGNADASIEDQSFRGKAQLDSEEAMEVFGEVMNGTSPFTIEAYAKPNGNGTFNMIASKGDECVALRFSGSNVDFFICNTSGNWVTARAAMSAGQTNRYVHIVGVYDGSSIYLYLDGVLAAKQDNAGAILASDYPLTFGYEPMAPTERVGTCLIRSFHVYSRALTAQEIADRSMTPADESAELWYDFDTLAFMENGQAIDATGIRTEVTEVNLEIGQTTAVAAEPVPYFAAQLGWSVADERVARVDNGYVTAVGVGKTTLTITAQGSGVSLEIPVTVTLPEGAVETVIAGIDAIVGNKTPASELEALNNLYLALTDEQKESVGSYRYEKLQEAMDLQAKIEAGEITYGSDVVEDQSANGFDLVVADQPDMTIEDGAMTGWGDVKGDNADEFFHEMFSGNNPFTVDVVMNPNGNGSGPNMIFSKGDETTAMRIYAGAVNFYIFEGNDTWQMITAPLSDSQLNSWIRITGVYTGSELQIFVNGSKVSSAEAGAQIPSDYPLGLGYCPMYPVGSSDPYLSWASFRNVHIYSRALSAQEISSGDLTAEDSAAVLWYDFDGTSNDYIENGQLIVPTGIRTNVSELRLLTGEKADIYADAVPYYSGNVAFSVADSSVAYVTQNGTVTAKKAGVTTVTVTVDGADLSVEIPVTVQTTEGAAVSIAQEAKALAEQAKALAEAAELAAEEAQAAADAAADVAAEDTEAAEKAAVAAQTAADNAAATQAAAETAQAAAEAAADAAENSNEAAAQDALDAAKDALSTAENALTASQAAATAAEAQQKAQAAQALAEEAAEAAKQAQLDAEEAQAAAEAAQAQTAEDMQAAKDAQKSAEEAQAAADAANAKAQAAKTAAEAAAKAADASNTAAAESAAQAAKDAASAAETAQLAAGYANAAAQAQLAAQEAQAAAEAAAKAAEEARKKAEEEAAARKAAAELATAKQAALIELMLLTNDVDTDEMSPVQREAYLDLVAQAIAQVEAAQDPETVSAVADAFAVEIEALLAAPSVLRFEDVKEEDWFFGSVDYVAVKGLMIGTSDTTFGPEEHLTRAQFATILYRIAGQGTVDTDLSFDDIPEGQWYSDAVLWAAENGIVLGNGDGTFGPEDNITREQMILMMFRYAKLLDMDTDSDGSYDSFADAELVSDYAHEAMNWAVGNKIISGKAGGTEIDPQGSSTRAECAAIIQRFFGLS